MYKYDTHVHTSPVSACAWYDVKTNLEFYKSLGYDGVFISNHFLDGNIGGDRSDTYENQIEFYFSDYEKGLKIGKQIGIKVFLALEMSYKGTDFLVFGLDKQWFLNNPQIMQMSVNEKFNFMRKQGAFVSQAHPYREAGYIDHIRLFPRCVDAVETFNANRTDFENKMAGIYAENYNLYETAGTDNHAGPKQKKLAGMQCKEPVNSVEDFIEKLKNEEFSFFEINL